MIHTSGFALYVAPPSSVGAGGRATSPFLFTIVTATNSSNDFFCTAASFFAAMQNLPKNSPV
ncbi:MAG: hypothetical protein AAF801_12615 [Pseudomonadota bacterium]